MRTIVHLSDLHFGRLDQRLVGPLLDAVNGASPDLVAVSGDFTQRARQRQFVEARTFLQAVSSPLLVVPGNHDVPLFDVARRFLSPLGRYRRYIATDLEPVFRDDEIIAIGLNSARSLTFGRGRLNLAQIRRATARLGGAAAGLIKIVVTHHPFDLPDDFDSTHLVGRANRGFGGGHPFGGRWIATAGAERAAERYGQRQKPQARRSLHRSHA